MGGVVRRSERKITLPSKRKKEKKKKKRGTTNNGGRENRMAQTIAGEVLTIFTAGQGGKKKGSGRETAPSKGETLRP